MGSSGVPITMVSGLPRSGTSMMMQMLEAGGSPVLTDRARAPDEDNPRGYYELEAVKRTRKDAGWLAEARGKAVKMVSMLLYDLPVEYRYRIVFMRRDLPEILASQRAMLERRGDTATSGVDDALMGEKFAQHLAEIGSWLAAQENMDVLYLRYDEVLADPLGKASEIAAFLDCGLDAAAMAPSCDPQLQRQRARAVCAILG